MTVLTLENETEEQGSGLVDYDEESEKEPEKMSKASILIVEDEILVAASIKIALQNLGYNVTSTVPSGEEAILKAKEDNPDLILMDIVLSGDMDGIEAASKIRSLYQIPFIYLTAYANGKTKERANQTNPDGYIIKPFKNRELNETIESALNKYRGGAEGGE
jgi:two-component system, response regulator PdtaR